MKISKKSCSVCKLNKPLSEYNIKTKNKDGKQAHCRECSHKKFAEYYNTNRDYHLREVRRNRRYRRDESRALLLEYLSAHACVDCGESDPAVLEFDHVRGTKKDSVSKILANYSWDKVLEEIDKCEVRCANCRRRITYKRMPKCFRYGS